MVAVALGVDAGAVISNPPILFAPMSLVISTGILSVAMMQSDLEHRTEAVIDPLTGLLNRNALRSRTQELAERSVLTGESIGVIVGDLDHFKQVNDEHGHAVGDAVLKDVAYLLRKELRAFDLAYRIGGEEFMILLPGADLPEAVKLADRLHRAVAADSLGGQFVTMSFGVSASEAGHRFDYDSVFTKADGALYEAKRSGRDRVCTATHDDFAAQILGGIAPHASA
jgi:diguanylate cyclase (GGDEF)-like protein